MPHIVNTDQATAWNGYEGAHWARNRDRWDAVNAGFNASLLTAAAIEEHHRVLDVGCGAGATTALAARRAASGHAWAWTCPHPCWRAHARPHGARTSAM